ncbi:ribonuclease H-like domain-containing protein [Tanacetum coccineum]
MMEITHRKKLEEKSNSESRIRAARGAKEALLESAKSDLQLRRYKEREKVEKMERTALLQQIILSIHQEFSMTDLGSLNYFLEVNCNPSRTPVDTESKLGADGDLISDPTLYRSLSELEYHGVANAVAETCWLQNLLRELHTPLSSATLVYCLETVEGG